jgi:hypothetical protein
MNIDEVWGSLEQQIETVKGGEWLARRLAPQSHCDIRIAVDRATRSRTILIRLKSAAVRESQEYPRARGYDVRTVVLPEDGQSHITLGVVLTDRAFVDIFSIVAEDITNRLSQIDNDSEAFSDLLSRLQSWQQFMECASPDGLGPEARRGLYGELYCLRHHLIALLGIHKAIEAWMGPSRTHQDFQIANSAIEVKTSIAKQHQVLRIASERQLDKGSLESLFLFHLSLDVRLHYGETLVAMVEIVRTLLCHDPSTLECFSRKLLESGYLDVHSAKYEHEGYAIREANFFQVDNAFPRITESELRPGVGDVHYSISVAECKHYQVDEEIVADALRSTVQ